MFHKRLLKEFEDNKKYVVGMVATQWVSLMANVMLILATSLFFLTIYQDNVSNRMITTYLMVLILTMVIRTVMNVWNQKMSFKASTIVKTKLREKIYQKLISLGSNYKEKISTSEAVQISTEGVDQLEIYFGKYVPQFFYSLLVPITLFIIVGFMSLKVAIVLLVCVPLIPISIVAVQKFAKKLLNKYWGTYTELGDSFLENLQGLTTLKIFGADARYAEKMDIEAEKFRKITMRVLIMQLNSISIMDLFAYGGAALGIILAVLECQKGNISLFQCFFIIMISAEFFLPLRLLGSFFHIAMNGNAAANKIFGLLDMKEEEDGVISDVQGNEITFEHVSFGYEEDKNILKDVSFSIQESGVTALVGASGCGKSTIASLIMGEYKKYTGDIQLGKHAIIDIKEKALFKKVTRIKNDSYLFAGTVRENLSMGNADATDGMMFEALKKVDLYDTVINKGGLDMELTEKANNLSGGQKQRLALARALLHDSDIYIFDEATSNVDVESENRIMQVIRELSNHKMVILISHRLANVVEANNILVIKEGTLVEDGSHQELMQKNGYYKTLFETQKKLESLTVA